MPLGPGNTDFPFLGFISSSRPPPPLAFFPLPVMVNTEAHLHSLLDVPSTLWEMQGSHLLGDRLRVLMQKPLLDPGEVSGVPTMEKKTA